MQNMRRKIIRLVSYILAAVSLFMAVCSGIFFCLCMEKDCLVTNSLELKGENLSLEELEYESLMAKKRQEVLGEAYFYLINNIMGSYSEIMDDFSEENSNYYFSVKPLDSSYPEMSNYYDEDYQYKMTGTYSVEEYQTKQADYYYKKEKIVEKWVEEYIRINDIEADEDYIASLKKSVSDKISILGVDASYQYHVLLNVDAGLSGQGEEFGQNNFEPMDLELTEDSDFTEWKKKTEEGMSEYYIENAYYDYDDEKIVFQYHFKSDVQIQYTEYVKKELTAHDEFFYSPILKYGDIIGTYTIPVFILGSIIFIAASAVICIMAGKKSDTGEITCGRADRVPFEIIIIIYGALGTFCALMLEVIYSKIYVLGIIGLILAAVTVLIFYPFTLCTVAVRIKTHTFLKSTFVYRILKFMKKYLKKIFKLISYLWKQIHIYGRFLGIYIIGALIEIFMINAVAGMDPDTLIIIVMTDLIAAIILIMAVINMNVLKKGAEEIAKGNTDYKIDTSYMLPSFKQHGETLNSIGDGIQAAVEKQTKSERMKTELITNVSHDIKTPITSIISYVDLLDKENLENERANEYIEVLKRQSERLKKLVQDLIDASKASTGNMPVDIEQVNINVMVEQLVGESMERLMSRGIKPVIKYGGENAIALADGRLLYRTMDNLIQNIYKYAMENSRVYIDVEESSSHISVTFKNISENELNISGDELMERFVRGDSSRNTEGSGLGLSIAKSLMEIQGGSLRVVIDGDLFKAVVTVKKM